MDPGPSVSLEEASPLAAGRVELAVLAQRLKQATARSRAIMDEIEQGLPQWQRLRDSAFARLQTRLDSMPVIEQAKGVLMAQHRCGPDEAFDLLRRASQHANIKVSVLATRIVEQVASKDTHAGRPRP
jgi:AmiR/NasT family two-component response regulator